MRVSSSIYICCNISSKVSFAFAFTISFHKEEILIFDSLECVSETQGSKDKQETMSLSQ